MNKIWNEILDYPEVNSSLQPTPNRTQQVVPDSGWVHIPVFIVRALMIANFIS